MKSRHECPHCGDNDTRTEWLDKRQHEIVEIRTCECGAEYENHLSNEYQRVVHKP